MKGERGEVLEMIEILLRKIVAKCETECYIAVSFLAMGNAFMSEQCLRSALAWEDRKWKLLDIQKAVRSQPYEDATWAEEKIRDWAPGRSVPDPKDSWASYARAIKTFGVLK